MGGRRGSSQSGVDGSPLKPGCQPADDLGVEDPEPRLRRLAFVALAVLSVGCLAFIASIYLVERGPAGYSVFWDDAVYNLVLLGAAAVAAARLAAPGGDRRRVGLLACAIALWAFGNLSWSIWVRHLEEPPYPSIGDVGWLLFYVPATFGMVRAFRPPAASRSRVVLIDAVVAGFSVAGAATIIVLGPVIDSASGSGTSIVTNTAYPVCDLIVLALLLALAGINGWRLSTMQVTLLVSLGLFVVADAVYVLRVANETYVSGTILDAGWLVPLVGMTWAVWQPDRPSSSAERPQHALAVAVPVAFLGAALAIAGGFAWSHVPAVGLVLLAIALAAGGWRMALTLRELERLAASERLAREERIEALSRSQEEVRRANDALEARVAERTSELQSTVVKLAATAERLERSNRELQDFAYVASHDLQEPLRKLQAFGSRLDSRYADNLPPDGRDYLDRMQSAAGRMSTLIEDLLIFSRVTSRGHEFSSVDLVQIVRDVLSDLELAIEESGATVEVAPLPTIDADPTQMRQLFQNLVSNALKFRQEGQEPAIRITSELVEAPSDVPNAGPGTYCRIAVRDNGIGFDEKYLDKIFTVFQRLHGQSAFPGSGIGLAVCRKIVERHHGVITARSSPGQGATFLLTVPLHQARRDEP